MEGTNANVTTKDIVLGLDSKVDALIAGMAKLDGQMAPVIATTIDHETRLRTLEKFSIRLSGAWVTVGIGSSVLAGVAGLVVGVAAFILH